MKITVRFLQVLTIVAVAAVLSSCEKRADYGGNGTAEFSLSMPTDGIQLKSFQVTDSINNSFQVLVSVEDMQGHAILTDKLIPVYIFGSGFVSEKVEISAGEFKLTKFMVINAAGEVIYASPVAGSPLAYLVNKPLPIPFVISADRTTTVTPEVLTVGDQTPDKFGYVNFGVQIIKPLAFWTGAVIDNPMIMAPFPLYTTAKLTVTAPDGWHYTFALPAALSQVVIRGGMETYQFVVEKEGFLPVKFKFTSDQLKAATRDNPLYLRIPYDSVAMQVLTIQPGPEAGKDAMISNLEPDKNFGGHKYFEATFLSEPVLTVMRTNKSFIFFNLNQLPKSAVIRKVMMTLTYELPIPFDSASIKPAGTSTKFIGCALQQIIEPWEENTITWNKQPAATEINQVLIAPFIRNINMIQVDVTRLFVNSAANALPNHGIKFTEYPDNSWPGMRFVSSDHPTAAYRPKLTIYYTIN
ncbi:MAG: DNRLRE domain-containing protein [Bacteroidales bacterium]